jgi:hypothetical protein
VVVVVGYVLAAGEGSTTTHLVTLKALRSRMQRRTERPTGGISSWFTRTNSMIELITTTKSNLGRKRLVICVNVL